MLNARMQSPFSVMAKAKLCTWPQEPFRNSSSAATQRKSSKILRFALRSAQAQARAHCGFCARLEWRSAQSIPFWTFLSLAEWAALRIAGGRVRGLPIQAFATSRGRPPPSARAGTSSQPDDRGSKRGPLHFKYAGATTRLHVMNDLCRDFNSHSN